VEWDEDYLEDVSEVSENAEEERLAEELAEVLTAASEGTEDLFVEVGDLVTYCPMDDPNDRHSVHIVDSESNAKMRIVNERTPLAQALLGLSPGDVGDLEIPGQKTRQLRILKIQRT
jgi:transcription elongation GreA/GreB family factor